MSLSDIPLFSALRAKMAWLSERQKLLSENVANADTPGYHSRDLAPADFQAMIEKPSGGGLLVTDARHLRGGGDAQYFNFKPMHPVPREVSPSGNSVSLEDEMIKVGQSQMEYEVTTNLYRKHAQLLKLALGRNG